MIRRAPLVLLGLLAAACGGTGLPSPGPTPIAGPPQIACPADITMRGVPGPTQSVTFSAPTVTGGELPNTVTCSRTSGAAFPLGTTAVSCSVSDARGRQATCAFNVTLTALALAVTKYMAIGDSLTEGQNGLPGLDWAFVDPANSYPTKLQALFDLTYPGQGVTVINRGIGGEPVEKTVLDLPGNLLKDRPGAVLVLTGYNNLLAGCSILDGPSHPRCPSAMDAVVLGVRDAIRRSREAPFNIPYVFVSTLTPPGPGPIPAGIRDRRLRADVILQVNARIRQVVAAERGVLADVYPRFLGREAEYVSIDGLHLLPPGNQALAEAFFAAIRATIPQTPLLSAR